MINRILLGEITRLAKSFPVLILSGPRQSGKTTLCKMAFPDYDYINLEMLTTRQAVAEDPMSFLLQHRHGVIIDEAQTLPDLFSYVQVVVDEHPDYRYILTGSNNFLLMEKVSQSLAGRAAVLTLLPLSLAELGGATEWSTDDLLIRGGYPAVWGAEQSPSDVYRNYYTTYVERDLHQLVNVKDLSIFQQFIMLAAGRVSTIVNAASLSAELGVSAVTVSHWLSVLKASYILFELPPYFRNVGKRILKKPKLYFHDTGLACHLLGINTPEQLAVHPLRGQLFENMVVSEFVKRRYNQCDQHPRLYYYRDNLQKEVDLIEERTFRQLEAYEIKSARYTNDSFGSGLRYFKKMFGEEVVSMQVLYDGEDWDASPVGYRNVRSLFCGIES